MRIFEIKGSLSISPNPKEKKSAEALFFTNNLVTRGKKQGHTFPAKCLLCQQTG
jgi:hypothetical protein